jgi:hypothetical protein
MGDKRFEVGARVLDSVRSRRGLFGASAAAGVALSLAAGVERAAAGGFKDKQRKRQIRGMTNDLRAMAEDVRQLEAMASQLDQVRGFNTLGEDVREIAWKIESKRLSALRR